MEKPRTLNLNLKKEWFRKILSGEKNDEYRKITPYFCEKFLLCNGKSKSRKFWATMYLFTKKGILEQSLSKLILDLENGFVSFKEFETTTFSNGMTPPVPRFEIEFKGFKIIGGKLNWGAEKGEKYFVLKLGKLLSKSNCDKREEEIKDLKKEKISKQIGCGYCHHEKSCSERDPEVNKAKSGCKEFLHFEGFNYVLEH